MSRGFFRAILPPALLLASPGGPFLRPALAGVELRVEPGRERVRPYESAPIQVRLTGADSAAGAALKDHPALRVLQTDGGWLSRPFRYAATGGDAAPGTVGVLYTAPSRPGQYTIEAHFKALRLHVEVGVSSGAPSRHPGEAFSFGPESGPRDFYRDLAEHYAPVICQETWFEPKADYLARVDYDGDWRGDNNWDNLSIGSSQAYVYYAAMETATHYFLIYDFFYPRHYSDDCSGDACHENDSSGLILTIRKDGSKYGHVQVMQTLAQHNIYSYTADSRIRDGAHRLNGELRLWHDSHPMIFIEAGSHDVYSAGDAEHSRFSMERMDFPATTGVVYRYGGAPARPKHANDHDVSYELLSATDHLWPRATGRPDAPGGAFAEFFRYAPFGNRPQSATPEMAAAFSGRKYGLNQARPFWGWYDAVTLNRKLLNTGQWGLDPAYGVWVSLKFPGGAPFSLSYTYNPYLESARMRDLAKAATVSTVARPGPETVTVAQAPPASPAPASTPRRERHLLSPPADEPNYRPKDKTGQLEFRARIDGALYLLIHGDQIEVEYLSGRPMDEIRYRFSQELPRQELDDIRVEDVEARGSIKLVEWPTADNSYTAKIRIQDEKPGAAIYRFRLAWRR